MDVPMLGTPATTVHPRTVLKPRSVATMPAATTVANSDEATDQPILQAEQDKGGEENLFDVFHGRLTGFALFTYSTTPTVPPVGSEMMAKRLPNEAS